MKMWFKYPSLFEIFCIAVVLSDQSKAEENITLAGNHSTSSTLNEHQQAGSKVISENSSTTTSNNFVPLIRAATISLDIKNSKTQNISDISSSQDKPSNRVDKKLNYFDDIKQNQPIKFSSKIDVDPLKSWSLSDKYSKLLSPSADDQHQHLLLDNQLFSVSSSTSSPDYISHRNHKRQRAFSSSLDLSSDQTTTKQPLNDDYSSLSGESESQKALQNDLNNPDVWSTTNEISDDTQPSITTSSRSRGLRYPKQYRLKTTSYSSSDNFSPLGKSSLRYLYDEDGAAKPSGPATIMASDFHGPPRLRLANSGIHLQQVYPPIIQQQQFQQYSQPAVFSLASVPNNFKSFSAGSGSNVYMSTVAPAINYETASSYRNTAGTVQRDLLNQPQTIQITSIPSGFGNTAPVIRVGALGGGLSSLFNNGGVNSLQGVNSYLDPLGRQVMMVNADRRQIDWSFWIWPLLAVIALPLILGALLVPVFLKTVVVIIQLLQSLGLLLPIANALGQQIAHASTSAIGSNQIEQGKT